MRRLFVVSDEYSKFGSKWARKKERRSNRSSKKNSDVAAEEVHLPTPVNVSKPGLMKNPSV